MRKPPGNAQRHMETAGDRIILRKSQHEYERKMGIIGREVRQSTLWNDVPFCVLEVCSDYFVRHRPSGDSPFYPFGFNNCIIFPEPVFCNSRVSAGNENRWRFFKKMKMVLAFAADC